MIEVGKKYFYSEMFYEYETGTQQLCNVQVKVLAMYGKWAMVSAYRCKPFVKHVSELYSVTK